MLRRLLSAGPAVALVPIPAAGGATSSALSVELVTVSAVSPLSATVAWRTTVPARSWVEYGELEPYGVWAPASPAASAQHSARLTALVPGRTYAYRIVSEAAGRRAVVHGTVTTEPISLLARAGARGRAIVLDEEPFFPIMTWEQCDLDRNLGLGINLFLGVCEPLGAQGTLDALAGRAYAGMPLHSGSGVSGRGLVGWHQMDEPDGNGVFPWQLETPPPSAETGRLTFMTLTPHFSEVGAPVSDTIGKDLYPEYVTKAEVIGFDVYPVGKYCGNPQLELAEVYDAQRDLLRLVRDRPTYQWIEASPLDGECPPPWPQLDPARLRAQVWLAIAGGATGIGYFPHSWASGEWLMFDVRADVQEEIARQNVRIRSLAAALLGEQLEVSMRPGSPVKVGARRHNGAVYVIAVNSSEQPVTTSFAVRGFRSATAQVYGEPRTHPIRRGAISDRFEPLAVHVYVVPPGGEQPDPPPPGR